jgi:hypothetical protein
LTAKRLWSEGAGSSLWREFGHRVIAGERIGVRRLQIPRQQLVDTVNRMIGDALEHRADKRLGVVAVEFSTAQQTVDRRSSLTVDGGLIGRKSGGERKVSDVCRSSCE